VRDAIWSGVRKAFGTKAEDFNIAQWITDRDTATRLAALETIKTEILGLSWIPLHIRQYFLRHIFTTRSDLDRLEKHDAEVVLKYEERIPHDTCCDIELAKHWDAGTDVIPICECEKAKRIAELRKLAGKDEMGK